MYFKLAALISAFIIACVSVLFIACTDIEPLFASIETEEKIDSGNLPDTITSLGMARIGDYYLVASGGAIYYRRVSGGDWSTYSLPSSYEGASKLVEAIPKTEAYAVLVKDYITSPSGFAMFKITSGSPFTFSKVHSSEQFMDIFAVPSTEGAPSVNVFAMLGSFSVRDINSIKYYQNYQDASPSILKLTQTQVPDRSDLETQSEIIIDLTYNSSDSKYYLANESSVFSVEANNQLKMIYPEVNRGKVPWGFIGGIYYFELNGTQRLLVSSARANSTKGRIWYSTNTDSGWEFNKTDGSGASWSSVEGDSYTFFTKFKLIDQTEFTGILVGTQFNIRTSGRDKGYYEMLNGNVSDLETPSGNKYTSGKLDTSGVTGFYIGENEFFVYTKALGLWNGNYGNSRTVDWKLE